MCTRISTQIALGAAGNHVCLAGSAPMHDRFKKLVLGHYIVLVCIQGSKDTLDLFVGDLRIALSHGYAQLVNRNPAGIVRVDCCKLLCSLLSFGIMVHVPSALRIGSHVRAGKISGSLSLFVRCKATSKQTAEPGLEQSKRIKSTLSKEDGRWHDCHHERQDQNHAVGRGLVRTPY